MNDQRNLIEDPERLSESDFTIDEIVNNGIIAISTEIPEIDKLRGSGGWRVFGGEIFETETKIYKK